MRIDRVTDYFPIVLTGILHYITLGQRVRNCHRMSPGQEMNALLIPTSFPLLFLMTVQRSTFILYSSDLAWVVRRAETENDVSSPCTFTEVYTCLAFLPLRPPPIAFIEDDTIDIQNVKRSSYLDQSPATSLCWNRARTRGSLLPRLAPFSRSYWSPFHPPCCSQSI